MDAPLTQESPGPGEETGRRGPGAFVGRERDLEELQAALAEAIGRHGSLVLVAGEAGIGRTRLAGELARRARSLGAGVRGKVGKAPPARQSRALAPGE
jgi:MoxR-like ATPase